MRINHWRQNTTQAEYPTYRELNPEEMTEVSGGLSLRTEGNDQPAREEMRYAMRDKVLI